MGAWDWHASESWVNWLLRIVGCRLHCASLTLPALHTCPLTYRTATAAAATAAAAMAVAVGALPLLGAALPARPGAGAGVCAGWSMAGIVCQQPCLGCVGILSLALWLPSSLTFPTPRLLQPQL